MPRACGEGPAVRDPMSPLPALEARPRTFGESTIGRDVPEALVAGIDRMDGAGRRQALRAIGRAGGAITAGPAGSRYARRTGWPGACRERA